MKKVIKLSIDDKTLEAEEGMTLLEAARQAGVPIPTLCYDQRLSPYGACRICMVESKEDHRLLAACSTPVEEGMDILTSSPAVKKARRKQLSLILLNHTMVCPSCEKGGSVISRIWSMNMEWMTVPIPGTKRAILLMPFLPSLSGIPTSVFSAGSVCGFAVNISRWEC